MNKFEAPGDTLEAEHQNASGGVYTDSWTKLRADYGLGYVYVSTTVDRSLQWWELPSADTVRGWVDELLEGTGFVRESRREALPEPDPYGAKYRYPIIKA